MMRATVSGVCGIGMVLAVAACHRGETPSATLGPTSVVSAATGVGTTPAIALSERGDRAVGWVSAPGGGTDGRLYISVNGAKPAVIADPLAPVQAHGEAPPRLVFGSDGSLNALYVVGKDVGRRFPVSALRFVRSDDGGRTWSTPITMTDDPEALGSHNFHSLQAASDGTLYAAWLDGRTGKPETYFTFSTDGGGTWAPNRRLSVGETCPCCRTGIVAGGNGVVYTAWRSVFPGNMRDIVVAHSSDRGATWSAPVRVHADGWSYPGCPHAGPSVQMDASGRVHVLWWTGARPRGGVFYATSADGGKTFSAPFTIFAQATPTPTHVQLAIQGSRVVAVWDAMGGHGASVNMRISKDGGTHFGGTLTLSDTAYSSRYPVVDMRDSVASVAWSQTAARAGARSEEHASHGTSKNMGLHAVGETRVVLREVRIP